MSRHRTARRLLALLRPLAPLMTISATARVANQGLGVAIPALAAVLVVGFETGGDIGAFVAVLAAMAIVKGGFRYLEQFTGHAVAFQLLAELRVDTYRTLVPLAPAGLEDERTGDLVARVIGDIDRVEPFYAHTIAPLVSAVVVPVVAAIGLAIWVDPAVAAVFIVFPVLMVTAVPWARLRRVASLSQQSRAQAGETTAAFTDAVQGGRDVAAFRAQHSVAVRVEAVAASASLLRLALARVAAGRAGLGEALAGGAVLAVAVVASGLYDAGAIDLAAMAGAVVVAWTGTAPARAVEDIVPDLEQALAAAGRLFELADRPSPVVFVTQPAATPTDGSIRFRGVTVRHLRSDSAALDEVDATVADGSFVAVVGPSGSGKSTLVELLVRFRDPERGSVQLGGVDLTALDGSTLRRSVTLVPQRPDIFFGTIADNLRLAAPAASDAELRRALDRADLGAWMRSLPRGLDTNTGELGEALSGGQRQRLAIARALLRRPLVLILDEATSELDAATEQLVLDEVVRARGDRTVVVVAHRLETVTGADQILVLDGGRLVDRGRHEDLLRREGVYTGLWARHLDAIGAER